ncbi:MAG: ABC transporter substrate-binding protein [Candidatus Loosdrechtia sp.]|uniref:ABC transporter substrate-binding protein n=1 Tax=Candidatus Loosdrechtia sp. TaxID=3101272 RepID=UPI003A6445EC|nr:MAG: ABC transporter substrate-binding protein [Candidatus Jettenia sp. AMX2]
MKILRYGGILCVSFFFMVSGIACSKKGDDSTVRVGYFPNMTHAQAVIGLSDGTFASYLGPDIEIKTTLFNAGPSLIEAVFSGDIDIAYVGPGPAINGYVRSNGKAFKVISGAVSGGSLFVVRPDSDIKKAVDLSGKRIASPQLGNTQDIALRGYLRKNGLKPREEGGTVTILPLRNPDILSLFLRGQIDGAWVPEPWGTRLIREAGGEIFLDESTLWKDGEFCLTLIIVRTDFLDKRPDLVKRWLAAHVQITRRINWHPKKAKRDIGNRLKTLTGISFPREIVDEAFSRLMVTYDPVISSVLSYAEMAYNAGFFGEQMPDLSGMIDLRLLNEVLQRRSLPLVDEKR